MKNYREQQHKISCENCRYRQTINGEYLEHYCIFNSDRIPEIDYALSGKAFSDSIDKQLDATDSLPEISLNGICDEWESAGTAK